MVSYRVMLDVPAELVRFVSGLLAAHRRQIGTRKGTWMTICSSSMVRERVPADLAGPASRAAAVARLAAAAGGRAARDDRPGRTLGWIRAGGQIAGHHVRIFTAITEETP